MARWIPRRWDFETDSARTAEAKVEGNSARVNAFDHACCMDSANLVAQSSLRFPRRQVSLAARIHPLGRTRLTASNDTSMG